MSETGSAQKGGLSWESLVPWLWVLYLSIGVGPEEEATQTDGQGQDGYYQRVVPLSPTFQGLESAGLGSSITLFAREDTHLGTSMPGRAGAGKVPVPQTLVHLCEGPTTQRLQRAGLPSVWGRQLAGPGPGQEPLPASLEQGSLCLGTRIDVGAFHFSPSPHLSVQFSSVQLL